jgi:predicted nucleic acid-binding protein
MKNEKVVIDSPVLIKLFTKEKDSEKALKILDYYLMEKLDIYISEISIFEMLYILSKYYGYEFDKLKTILSVIINYGFNIIGFSQEILEKAIEIMILEKMSVYTAFNIALALKIGGSIVTTDKKLKEKIGNKYRVLILDEIIET